MVPRGPSNRHKSHLAKIDALRFRHDYWDVVMWAAVDQHLEGLKSGPVSLTCLPTACSSKQCVSCPPLRPYWPCTDEKAGDVFVEFARPVIEIDFEDLEQGSPLQEGVYHTTTVAQFLLIRSS